MTACCVKDLPAKDKGADEVASLLGLSAEDTGDEVRRVLQTYCRYYDYIEGPGDDSARFSRSLADLVTPYLECSTDVRRTTATAGRASRRLGLAVRWFNSEDNNP